jgi:hypothetical protein
MSANRKIPVPKLPPPEKTAARKVHLLRACLAEEPSDLRAEKAFQMIVRTAVKRSGGLLLRKVEKDSLALFESASGALQAALRIDTEVRRVNRRSPQPLEVQIAVQTDSQLTPEERLLKPAAAAISSGAAAAAVHGPFLSELEDEHPAPPPEDLRQFTLEVFNSGKEKFEETVERHLPVKELLLGSLVLATVAFSLMIPLQKPPSEWLSHLSFFNGARSAPAPAVVAVPPAPVAAAAPVHRRVRRVLPSALLLLDGDLAPSWDLFNADGSSARKRSVAGAVGKALRIDYDFGSGGWIQIKRDLSFGPEISSFKGAWQAEGARNRLQIELVDEDGSTFVYGWTLEAKEGWTPVEIPLRDFAYSTGGDMTLGRVTQVYFTLSKKDGGSGTVLLDGWTAQ